MRCHNVERGQADQVLAGRGLRWRRVLVVSVFMLTLARNAFAVELVPFATQNQSPLVRIFGLPAAGSAQVATPGHYETTVSGDWASNYVREKNAAEAIVLDGESYRVTFAARAGISPDMEVGIELPFAGQGGGVLDGFIIGWHDFFGLPQGGREEAQRDQLNYSYTGGGLNHLSVTDSSFGLGDLSITGGWQLHRTPERRGGVALRASLKLPTGNDRRLHGSGSTDLALWLSGADSYTLSWGEAAMFGALGGMAMTRGNVLKEKQRPLAAFGSLGGGWSPTDWLAFKIQVSSHTPLYKDSQLKPLNATAVQLLFGGTIGFSPRTSLDIAVSEDLAVNTSPDVAFHLALSRRF